jgi:cell division protein FtsQ
VTATKTPPTGSAPVHPRVRERWVEARRAEGRRRLRILVMAAVVVFVAVAIWAVVASPFLDVDHVDVRGAHRLTSSEIVAASGISKGDAMVWLDAGAAERRVAALPWIASVHVAREWPGTVKISVVEREPVAWVDAGAGPVLVDGTGRVLAAVPEAPTGLPRILDPALVPPPGADIAPLTGAHVAGKLVGYARLGTQTISLEPNGVTLGLVNGGEIRLGTPAEVMPKVGAALAVFNALGGPVAYVDVSVPSNPVAGPPA